MLNKWRALIAGLLLVGLMGSSFGQVELKIGNVTVPPQDIVGGGCIQVPIMINDPDEANRDFRDITFTVELSDPSGVIDGGIAADVLVANGFAAAGVGTGTTGLTDPATDLVNNNGTDSPTCAQAFNRVTQGQGTAIDFVGNTNAFANWSINNNQGGAAARKQGFLFDPVLNGRLGEMTQNTDILLGVLEIPIIANPGQAQILITATPVATLLGGNTYTWDNGIRVNDEGERVQIIDDFVLPANPAQVNIFDPVNCAGATTANPSIDWADPNDGGTGGTIAFTFPGTTNADRVHIVGNDGYDALVASAGASTPATINTDADASPDPDFDVSYNATYQVEFPPSSGTFVDGTPCVLAPPWTDASAAMAWDPTPVITMDTTLDITLTNARWDAANNRYGNLTGPNLVDVDLAVPTSGAGTNVLVFADALTIIDIDNTDVGTYTVAGIGAGTNTYTESIVLTLEPPDNETVCANITAASIEGSVTIPLAGNEGTIDFTVIYDGTTYDNLPEGDFVLPDVVGDETDVITRANGFDAMGAEIFDEVICDLNFAAPTCTASQDPPGTVDVGEVITLFLDTTNAIAATVEGAPMGMTPDVDPDDNFNVQWSTTHIANADTVLTGTVTNSDGETSSCTWTIDINCIDPSIVSVGSVGGFDVVITGTFECTYTVRITLVSTGVSTDYDVDIDTLTNPTLNEGIGTLEIEIPPDAWIEVGQEGFPSGTDIVPTVPTLSEWGLIAFITLLMGSGVVLARRRSTAA